LIEFFLIILKIARKECYESWVKIVDGAAKPQQAVANLDEQ